MNRHMLTGALLACLVFAPAAPLGADAKADKEAARREKQERAAQKRTEREAERARVQAERLRVEQERQARRGAERQRRSSQDSADGGDGGSRESSNESVRTQRQTADTYAERRRRSEEKETDATSGRPPTTAPSEPAENVGKNDEALAEIRRQIQEEDQRHAAADLRYRRAIESARRARNTGAMRDAETALQREDETYRRNMQSLTRRRDALLKEPAKTAPPPAPSKDRSHGSRARL